MRCPKHKADTVRQMHSRRRGVTLVELTLNLTVTAVLMGGIMSVMLLASRAVPDGNRPVDALLDGADIVNQIVAELHFAKTVPKWSATAVTFTVADRNDDSANETIRYAWSAVPGDPLTREYNGGAARNVLPDVREFDLTYDLSVDHLGTSRLTGIGVTLRTGAEPSTRAVTAVQVLNLPEVTGP